MAFLFPTNMILPFCQKSKDNLLPKNTLNPNKAGLFEGSFFWGVSIWPLLPPPSGSFQRFFIYYETPLKKETNAEKVSSRKKCHKLWHKILTIPCSFFFVVINFTSLKQIIFKRTKMSICFPEIWQCCTAKSLVHLNFFIKLKVFQNMMPHKYSKGTNLF